MLGIAATGSAAGKQAECQLFQRGRCHYGDHCKYAHIARTEPVRAFETVKGMPRVKDAIIGSKHVPFAHTASAMAVSFKNDKGQSTENGNSYPVRTGAADCQYYLKTGKCNYGSRCKFNHPFRDENLVNALNRRDCFDFVQKGTCPYGRSCKYNHPLSEEDGLAGLESQPTSTSDSRSSSPRSISRNTTRRSTSEPRYSTIRDLSEDYSISQGKLAIRTRGRIAQPPSKWDVSPGSSDSLAKQLANDAKEHTFRSLSKFEAHQGNAHAPAFGTWSQNNEERLKAPPYQLHRALPLKTGIVQPRPAAPQPFGAPGFSRGSAYLQPDTSIASLGHDPHNVLQAKRQKDARHDTQSWFSLDQSGPPSLRISPSMTSSQEGLKVDSYSAGETQRAYTLGTSIWGSDVCDGRQGGSAAVLPPLYDYGAAAYEADPLPDMGVAANACSRRDNYELPGALWSKDRTPDICGPSEDIAVAPRTSAVELNAPYGYMQGSAGGLHVTNPWQLRFEFGGRGQSFGELQLQRHRQQVHRRRQQEQNASHHMSYHTMNLQAQIVDRAEGLGLLPGGFVERDMLGQKTSGHFSPRDQMQEKAHDLVATSTKRAEDLKPSGWDGLQVDQDVQGPSLPEGRAGRFFGAESLGDVWRPTEKSPTFGPGLFGMQHHMF